MERPILSAMLSCQGTSLTDEEKRLFSKYNPIGISLFDRNLKNINQVKKLISEIKSVINRDNVLIAIDQEGGRVSRLSNIIEEKFASAESLGLVEKKYSKMQAILISNILNNIGINVNYAPVVDKMFLPQSKVLETRCFSQNTKKIISRATIMADTYMENGICPCIKHIPGHFNTIKDPHLDILKLDDSRNDILKNISYLKQFSDYPMAMTSHIILSSIDNKNPTSTSQKVISTIIRNEIGFDGLLISDAIDMHALSGDVAQKAKDCINAGCDIVCYCSGKYSDMVSICSQNLFMSEKSLNRFDKINNIFNNKIRSKNIEAIRYKYQEKMSHMLNMQYAYDATEVLNKMLEDGDKR